MEGAADPVNLERIAGRLQELARHLGLRVIPLREGGQLDHARAGLAGVPPAQLGEGE